MGGIRRFLFPGCLLFVASLRAAQLDEARVTQIVNDGVVVNVIGPAASVYVNSTPGATPMLRANYTGFGGNNTTTGTFAGSGTNAPQPLRNAPPLGSPPGGLYVKGCPLLSDAFWLDRKWRALKNRPGSGPPSACSFRWRMGETNKISNE